MQSDDNRTDNLLNLSSPESGVWPPRVSSGLSRAEIDEHREVVAALRNMLDAFASSSPDRTARHALLGRFNALTTLLTESPADQGTRLYGHLPELPGRGNPMLPMSTWSLTEDGVLRGTSRFSGFFLGGNNAVHGGAVGMLVDEICGEVAEVYAATRIRTAYLHVNFRSVTPLNTELDVEAHVTRVEGRKHFVSALIRDGDTVCVDAEGLYIELRRGQP